MGTPHSDRYGTAFLADGSEKSSGPRHDEENHGYAIANAIVSRLRRMSMKL
jgi:hypothetical protein